MIKTEMATNTNMGGPSGNPFTQALPLTKETTKAMEIKLNQPKPFTRKREDLKKFLQDTNLYLLVNNKVYDTDIKKIAFHEQRRHSLLERAATGGRDGPQDIQFRNMGSVQKGFE